MANGSLNCGSANGLYSTARLPTGQRRSVSVIFFFLRGSGLAEAPRPWTREKTIADRSVWRASHVDPAVDMDDLAGDPRAAFGEKEFNGLCDVLRLSDAPQRRLGPRLRDGLADSFAKERGVHGTWCHTVHPDPVGAQFDGKRLGQTDHTGFRRRVVGKSRPASTGSHRRRHRDNRAAGSLADHDPGCLLGGDECTSQVDVQNEIPAVFGHFEQRRRWADAAGTDEAGQAVGLRGGLLDELAHTVLASELQLAGANAKMFCLGV